MPAQITPDRARARLDELLPNWRWILINEPDAWVRSWREASGDSRATTYRMQAMAYQLNSEDADAILHLYEIGAISEESCKLQLFDFMTDRVKAQGGEPLFERRGEEPPSDYEPISQLVRIPGTNLYGVDVGPDEYSLN